MRSHHPLANLGLCTVVAALLALPSFASDWSLEDSLKRTSVWSGFGVGTMIHHRVTTEIQVRGRPDMDRESVTETRMTLVEVTEAEFVVKVEERADGEWVAKEVREPRDSGAAAAQPTVEPDGEESVRIGEKTYPCKKRTVSDVAALLHDPLEGEDTGGGEWPKGGTVWEHETLGVLKVETSMPAQGRTATRTQIVTNLDVRRRVGETTISCRELSWSTNMLGGKTVRLVSPTVPGRTVLTTGTVEQGPVTMTHRRELVGLTTRPASTGAPR